ncbi:MAG TPA: hypothetical protein IAA45_07800 [Candidatus Blautia gallistercoris]|uniref:Uncharacterized protein n=1 Tax=Candidatus Blautia gallistercoris TaxID=2838490 RepID=A0A9D1WI11_9FIRM|nr:hypothetical protein [Candidatus Blautia gallistercoris]
MRTSAEPNRYEYSGKAENGNPCRTKPVVSTVEKPETGTSAELNRRYGQWKNRKLESVPNQTGGMDSGKAGNCDPCRTKPVVSTVEKPETEIRAEPNRW